jgi:hypothetical protein
VAPDKLTVGSVYHMIVYEDEAMAKMSIQSYEYLGPRHGSSEPSYRFRPLSPFPLSDEPNARESIYDGELDVTAKNLQSLADLPGLIDQLQRIQRNGPGRMWADAS